MICALCHYQSLVGGDGRCSTKGMWQRRTVTWCIGLLSGCSGGQSGDPGYSPVIPDVTPATDCEVIDRLPDEPFATTSRCEVEDDSVPLSGLPVAWSCECGDTARTVSAPYCHDALGEACDVDAFAATFCEAPLGTCFPQNRDGSEWSCSCARDSGKPGLEVSNVATRSCHDAASIACGQTCESDVGSCTMMNEAAPQGFVCTCSPLQSGSSPLAGSSLASGPIAANGGQSCEATLDATCGGACETESGRCTYAGDHFACACNDENTVDVDVATLFGAGLDDARDQCGEAVRYACGLVTSGGTCSSETAQWSVTCTARPLITFPGEQPAATKTFDCDCRVRPSALTMQPDAGSSTSVEVDAHTCDEAAKLACPGAIRTSTDTDSATLDYGHNCTIDADCSGGACYVPGTTVNPICSKHCETNADCPDFARCATGAGGYCFVRCTSDAPCLELNPALSNPLHCSTSYPEIGSHADPGICVQTSEP